MNKVAINGFGRIGRMVLRSIIENKTKGIKVVAINNRADSGTSAFLLEKDSIHGNLDASIQFDKKSITVNGQKIILFHEDDPTNLPWKKLGIDTVLNVQENSTLKNSHLST